MVRCTRVFLALPLLSCLSNGCDFSLKDSAGESVCLDEFLESLGKDRGVIEEEAARRGIEASALIAELVEAASGVVGVLFDCSASESLEDLSEKTGGKYEQAEDPDKMVDKILDYNKGITAETEDLVLLIDATGSMSDDIGAVKSRLSELVESLGGRITRLSIASFRDANVDSPWYERNSSDFIDPGEREFNSFLSDISATGGGDLPESLYDAVYRTATELDWTSEARVIIAVTDAPPLTGKLSTYSASDAIDVCNAQGISVMTILVGM